MSVSNEVKGFETNTNEINVFLFVHAEKTK